MEHLLRNLQNKMMIIHSPQPWVEVNQSDNRYEEGNREAWRALEEAYEAGNKSDG